MTKVGAESELYLESSGTVSGFGSTSTPLSSNRRSTTQSPSVLQSRMHSTLWQMTVVFQNAEDCAAASAHVLERRQIERAEKMTALQDMIRFWSA